MLDIDPTVLLLSIAAGGGLTPRPPPGGGGSSKPEAPLLLALTLSLLGMLMFTFMVCPSLKAKSSCG